LEAIITIWLPQPKNHVKHNIKSTGMTVQMQQVKSY